MGPLPFSGAIIAAQPRPGQMQVHAVTLSGLEVIVTLQGDDKIEDLALAIADKANLHETRLGIVGPGTGLCSHKAKLSVVGISEATPVTIVQERRAWQMCDTGNVDLSELADPGLVRKHGADQQSQLMQEIWDRLWCIVKLGSPWLAPSPPV